MKVLMNKLSGDLVLACEVWVKVSDLYPEGNYDPSSMIDLEALIGAGIGMQTQHDVWLVFPHSVSDQFEEIGDL